jgi:RsiW-degrading membrane proteinase PrsW (M82 family)
MDKPYAVVCPSCKTRLKIPAGFTGTQVKCPKCSAPFRLARPESTPAAGPAMAAAPSAPQAAPAIKPPSATPRLSGSSSRPSAGADYAAFQDAVGRAHKSGLRFLRWAFLLAILPLAWYTLMGGGPDFEEAAIAFSARLEERLATKPELKKKYEDAPDDTPVAEALIMMAEAFDDAELINELNKDKPELAAMDLPDREEELGNRLVDIIYKHSGLAVPLLQRDTWGHWGLAAVAAVLFMLYFCFAYPRGNAKPQSLVAVGAFTGTLGIVLLLVLQWVASFATGLRVRGGGIIVIIWLILMVIGFSYAAADDPTNGFWLSFLGFTIGVGLCEELCKAIPVISHYKSGGGLGWAGACLWGLVSGAGFGVSEGIIYSSRYYNGRLTLGIYVVRFISCVGMHAAWSGVSAILLYRRRDHIRNAGGFWEMTGAVLPTILVVMVLHGLYDTLLKMDMSAWALLTGAISFAYFVFLQEREARGERLEGLRLLNASQPRTSRI